MDESEAPGPGRVYILAQRMERILIESLRSESLSFGRTFGIREGKSFQIRAEFFNVFNRVFLSAPTSTNAAASQVRSGGQTVSGFGYINTSVTSIQTGGAVPTVRNP